MLLIRSENLRCRQAENPLRLLSRFAGPALISPAKGQLDAVLATHRLLEEGYAVELCLTGYHDAPYVDAIRKYIEGNDLSRAIRINEFTDHPFDAIRAMDVVISCSRHEAFGRSIVEAMLLGKPIIFPDAGGPAEYLRDGVTGFAYTPGNYFELAGQIKSIIENPEQARETGRRARLFAQEKFANATYAEKIVPILTEAIEETTRRIVPPRQLIRALESQLESLSEANSGLQQSLATATAENLAKSRALVSALHEAAELKKERVRLLDASERKDDRLLSLTATLQFKNSQIRQLSKEANLLKRNLQNAAATYDADMNVMLSEALQARIHLNYLRRKAAGKTIFRAATDAMASVRAWMTHGVPPKDFYAVRSSLYFDRDYYLQNNPDVSASGLAAEVHYILHGSKEGRDPGPFFSSSQYQDANAACMNGQKNPLIHYERHGTKDQNTVAVTR